MQMNIKKILILPIGFLCTNILYISCCKCVDSNDHFYEVRNVTVKPLGSGGAIIDTGIPVTADTVFLNYFLGVNCVAAAKTDLSFLVNGAYACKCRECGDRGLKYKLLAVNITSDNVFNGVAANAPLNAFFKVKGDYVNPDFPLDSLLPAINTENGFRFYFSVFTKTKSGNTAGHKFKLNMSYANNTAVTAVTNAIVWQ